MRALYLLSFLWLGAEVWPRLLWPDEPWNPLPGVAFSFWAALSALCGLGLRYPLQMLPLLLLQLVYKSIWLIAVGLPLGSAGRPSNLTEGFLVAVALDLIAIPWPYVLAHYVRKRGERWR
jgi:hypothetical protein